MAIRVITNNVPRYIIEDYELSPEERSGFDYLDWPAIDEGRDSASFVRYKGQLYDLNTFMRGFGIIEELPDHLARWDGYHAESFFSAVVVRLVDDERVIVGRVLS